MLFSTVLTLVGIAGCAGATTFTFNFNTLAENAVSYYLAGGNSPGTTSINNAIAQYMDSVIGCTNCVSVTGAIADKTYSGEGYVVGPGGVPETLGTSDGATSNSSKTPSCTSATLTTSCTDTFLANTSDDSSQRSQEISISFTGLSISSVGFDYEIFPDGSCSQLDPAHCGGTGDPNRPDFIFTTGAASGGTQIFQTFGFTPSSGGPNGISTKDGNTTIYAPQFIGTTGGMISVGGVSELNFVDWPATIGIDNLVITTNGTVPEPSSVLLLATACAGAVLSLRRKFNRQS
ncbi:MAG TPA: PEP-CTERM sorting domain-containing protein [Bryobacteraceae bacterium]|nr:PEP-CTERM sorting domain-containing protein [Bryobacteraceae bacterium]